MPAKPDGSNAGDTTRRETTRYFDSVADSWEAMREAFFTEGVRQKAVQRLAPRQGAKAADIGAGSGFMTHELLRLGLQVVAVDGSASMVERLRERFAAEPDLTAMQGDAESLPIEDASVDYCFANMFLHHAEDPRAALREMSRVLRPGGQVALTDLDSHSFEFLLREHHDRWPGFERDEIRRWMCEAGLEEAEVVGLGEQCCATSGDGCTEAKVGIFLATARKP